MKELFRKLSQVFNFLTERKLINQKPTEVVTFEESEENVIEVKKATAKRSDENVSAEKEIGRKSVIQGLKGLGGKIPRGLGKKPKGQLEGLQKFFKPSADKNILSKYVKLDKLNVMKAKKITGLPDVGRKRVQGKATPSVNIAPTERAKAVEQAGNGKKLAEMLQKMNVDIVISKKNKVNFIADFSEIPKEKIQALSNVITNNDVGLLKKKLGRKTVQKIYKKLLAMKLLGMNEAFENYAESIKKDANYLRSVGAEVSPKGKMITVEERKTGVQEAKKLILSRLTEDEIY